MARALMGILVLLLSSPVGATGGEGAFTMARLIYPGHWNPRPQGLTHLLAELARRTSIEPNKEVPAVRLTPSSLFRHPFLVLSGDQAFGEFSAQERLLLRSYLDRGGFLLIDSTESREGGAFDQAVRREVRAIFPDQPLRKLPSDHVVWKSFYLLRQPSGRMLASPFLEGIEVSGRLVLAYCQNDLQGAWSRDGFGRYLFQVNPGGEHQRELAFRMGINLCMYTLCLDYKADQVHLPFILKRRKWRIPD